MEAATPDLGKTLTAVLDLATADGSLPLPVKEALAHRTQEPAPSRATALSKANHLIASILRDNQALSRQSFLEFDLEAIFTGEV